LFSNGLRVPLTNSKNKQQRSENQENDKDFTRVDFDEQKIDLGKGEIVKVESLMVDGSDPRDQRLGVQVVLDIGGQSYTLTFSGNERFLLQSKSPEHVIKIETHTLRFGIEIQSQRLALLLGRF
jgi:hypothetical protein